MDIVNYIKNLANTTSRASIMKNLAELRIAYRESLPIITDAVKAIGSSDDFSPELRKIHQRFGLKNFGKHIEALFKAAPKLGELLEDKLTSEFDGRIANSGLSYRQANILMLAEMYAFLHRYSLRYLSACFDAMENIKAEEAVSRAEIAKLTEEAFAFARGLELAAMPIDKLAKLLDETTEAIVDRETHAVFSATQGANRVDPLTLGFIDVRFNPFFLIGRYLADKEIEGYYTAREERESLSLRLIRLRERQANQPTQELQDTILEIEDQIRRRQRKIDEMEAKYGN